MCWTRCKCGTHHFLLVDKIYHVPSGEFLREKMVSYGVNLNERTKPDTTDLSQESPETLKPHIQTSELSFVS